MFKKLTALVSMFGIFASLVVFQPVAYAAGDTPDFLVWLDAVENVRWDVTDLLGSEPVPFGGLQNEYLAIGSSEPFYGVEITFENGSTDGEFSFQHYPQGSGPYIFDDLTYTSLEGSMTVTWDTSDWGDWQSYSFTDAQYGATEGAFESNQGYIILLSTDSPSSNDEVLTISELTLITEQSNSSSSSSSSSSSTATTTTTTTTTSSSSLSHSGELTFSDVPRGEEETVEIEFLVADGVLEGYSDGTYGPDNAINRAELMKILVYGQGIDPTGQFDSGCLSDIPAGEWYEASVCYAVAQGWVEGYSDGTFKPAQTVNRAEAAKMVVNAMGFGNPDSVADHYIALLPDVSESDWFAGYVATLSSAIVVPNSESFNPADGMTRESAASFIFRVRALQETSEDYYTTDVREEFLELYGLESLIDLAYTESSNSSSSSSSSVDYSASFSVSGSCSGPKLTVTNYSGVELDFSSWYIENIDGDEYYPFSGITLANGESAEVYPSGSFGADDTNQSAIYLYNPDGGYENSSSCSNT